MPNSMNSRMRLMGSETLSVSISQALKITVNTTVSDKSYLIECQQWSVYLFRFLW